MATNLAMEDLTPEERDKIIRIMDRIAFFRDFTDYEKRRITSFHTHLQSFKMGAYIIKEGGTDTSFFILLTGAVSVVKAGKSSTLAQLQAGDFVGEVSFLTNRKRTTNVVANEPVVALRVDKELMAQLGPEIREKIKDRIIDRLVARMDEMNGLVGQLSQGFRY
ncbi:MAG: cyclic nucleotide-binding domain-containing protein [Magnetococcales bacterium]|nr:cyclic nucleotide-binding domain-containing protein [Magnetococcales bacterium]